MNIKVPVRPVTLDAEGFHFFIDAVLNSMQINMLVDTGASKTVFDINRINRYLPKRKKTFKLFDNLSTGLGTNTMKSYFIRVNRFCISELELQNYDAVLLDMKHVNKSYKILKLQAIDGVLGSDFLMKYKAVIDLKKMILKLNV